MNTTVAEKNEAQDQEPKNRYSIAGASPMGTPDKKSLYKHVARADIAVAEAAEIFGAHRDKLARQFAEAVKRNDAQTALGLATEISDLERGLAYLRMTAAPIEWQRYLPAIRLDDPLEAQQ